MTYPCRTELNDLNSLIWGQPPLNIEVFKRWCQGFHFSSAEPTALVQGVGGPCAVLAPVQAVILRDLLFSRKRSLVNFSEVDNIELLICAIVDILVSVLREPQSNNLIWVYWSSQNDEMMLDLETACPDHFFRGLKLIATGSTDELHAVVLSLTDTLQSPYGVLCFLYSVLFTRGVSGLRSEVGDETEPLIDPVHGHASQCLINLLISGQLTSYLFDGERNVSGITLTGVLRQPCTGYLTLFEALHYCESGWYLKNPSYPVWILASETHFTVLASPESLLVSADKPNTSEHASIREAELAFERLSADRDDHSGFIPVTKLDELLTGLRIPFTDDSLLCIIRQLDPEDLGIILQEAFLKKFFPNEMANRRSAVQKFEVIHYNGLEKSHSNGQVRYKIGEACLMDPTDELADRETPDQSPIHRCLRTKWPTIRVKWENNEIPSLN